jgi:hypothetical protein
MIDPSGFREVVRTVTVHYPVPFVLALLSAFALACFGLAAIMASPLNVIAGLVGAFSGAGMVGLSAYVFLLRPELLRSEKHSLVSRAFDIFLDPETSNIAREQTGRVVDALLAGEAVTKESVARGYNSGSIDVTEAKR